MPALSGGPFFGPICDRAAILCECVDLPPPLPPEPDGSLALLGDGAFAWYDARYGDIIHTSQSTPSMGMDLTALEVASGLIAGSPEFDVPTHDPNGWRKGSTEPGPDIGRGISTLAIDDDQVLIAAENRDERTLKLYLFSSTAEQTTPVALPMLGTLLSRPHLYLNPDNIPCVAVITEENTRMHAISRLCAQSEALTMQWIAQASTLVQTVATTEATCPAVACSAGTICAAGDAGIPECITPGEDCEQQCNPNSICGQSGFCVARVVIQDTIPVFAYPLSVASGPESVIAVTSQMGPSKLLGARWSSGTIETAAFRDLSPSGGRGVLDVAAQRTGDTVWIAVALDRAPNLLMYRWDDGDAVPVLRDPQPAPMPNAPQNFARTLLSYHLTGGSQRWLVKAEPNDDVWLLAIDTLGTSSWTQIISDPVAGFAVSGNGSIYSWFVNEGSAEMKLGVRVLSGE